MKTDGITLLDQTSIETSDTENIGTEFPQNPEDGMLWTLVNGENEQLGNFVYGLGRWLPRANKNLTYSDVSFSTEGQIPNDTVVTRYVVGKTSYLPQDLSYSLAVLLVTGALESSFVVKHIRNGVETELADIVFASGSHEATITSKLSENMLLVSGDVIVFESKTVDTDASDVCVTLSTYLA